MDKFIEKYILCPKCKYPETSILVKKERVQCQCDSCGFKGELDNVHKLASYIIKNPPKTNAIKQDKNLVSSKKNSKAE